MRSEALVAELPGRLDRATFDRVLQRAAELQASSKDIGEGLSEEEILALGAEVGIPAQHLQQALIEERTRVALPEPSGLLDHWVGPADFIAQRVVQGTTESVSASLTQWMQRQEHLVVQRSSGSRITWEPMDGFARGMRRLGAAFDPNRAKPYLDKVELVTGVITPLEAGFCHVALAASLRKSRAALAGGGLALPVTGAVVGGVLVLIGAPLLVGLVPVLPMALVGWAVARTFRRHAQRAQLGLERALDELEQRPVLPSGGPRVPPRSITRGVGQVVRDITQEVRKALEE
jgi:hypothetical protein